MSGMKRNKISFGTSSTVVFEKEIEDEEHQNAVWFSQKEMKGIRKDLKKSIKKGEITRGLEHYEGDMGKTNKQYRLNHIRQILELQAEQERSGVKDDKGFALLSKSLSADNLRKAQLLASRDSSDAFAEYQKDKSNAVFLKSKKNEDFAKQTAGLSLLRGKSRRSTPNMFLTALSENGTIPMPKPKLRTRRMQTEGEATMA